MSGKRRKRRKQDLAKILRLLILALILSAAFVCQLTFSVTHIEISGNWHESEEAVESLICRGPLKNNTLFLSAFYNNKKIKGNSFIDTVDVRYVKKDSVSVQVNEKHLVGYVRHAGSYWYFDQSGTVLVQSAYNESQYKALARGEAPPSGPVEELPDASASSAAESVTGTGAESWTESGMESGAESWTESAVESGADSGEETAQKSALIRPDMYMTDEETYVEPETAEYDEGYDDTYDETDTEETYDGTDAEEEYSEDWEEDTYNSEEEYYDEEEKYEDDGQDEVILIQPELTDEASPTPIPAQEPGEDMVTPIPAEEMLIKEYTPEDTFEGNYIPEISGLQLFEVSVGERLPARYASIYTALGTLKTYVEENGMYPSSVDLSKRGQLQIHFNDVNVNLGTGDNLWNRLNVLKQVLDELLGRSGTLHLENYDGSESRLIFSKNEKNS